MKLIFLFWFGFVYSVFRIDIATAVDYPDTHPDYLKLYNYVDENIERTASRQRLANRVSGLYEVLTNDRGNRLYDSGLYQALKEIKTLITIRIDKLVCTGAEADALIRPIAAKTRVHRYYANPSRELGPMEELLHFKMLRHSQICVNKYSKTFKRLNRMTSSLVTSMAMTLLGEYAYPSSYADREGYLRALVDFVPSDHYAEMVASAAIYVHSWVIKPEERSYPNEVLYDRYIQDPCNYFVNLMGRDVFEPTLFEAQMYERIESAFDLYSEATNSFFIGLATYNVCRSINHNQDFKLLVLEAINQHLG